MVLAVQILTNIRKKFLPRKGWRKIFKADYFKISFFNLKSFSQKLLNSFNSFHPIFSFSLALIPPFVLIWQCLKKFLRMGWHLLKIVSLFGYRQRSVFKDERIYKVFLKIVFPLGYFPNWINILIELSRYIAQLLICPQNYWKGHIKPDSSSFKSIVFAHNKIRIVTHTVSGFFSNSPLGDRTTILIDVYSTGFFLLFTSEKFRHNHRNRRKKTLEVNVNRKGGTIS